MSEKNPVAQPSKLWAAQTATWDLVNTLFGGTDAMRDAAKVYLPPAGIAVCRWHAPAVRLLVMPGRGVLFLRNAELERAGVRP